MKRDMLYRRLLEVMGEKECPVCHLRNEAEARYMKTILHEQVNDPGVRQSLIRSKGFCQRHAWALTGLGDSLGIAIIYREQVVEALQDLYHASRALGSDRPRKPWRSDGRKKSRFGGVLSERRTPGEPCPVCRIGEAAQDRSITTLLSHLDDPDFQEAVVHSPFVCLPDLVRALKSTQVLTQAQQLLDLAEVKLRRLEEELSALVRKRDYRFLREPRGSEQTSWFRAIGQLVGWPAK